MIQRKLQPVVLLLVILIIACKDDQIRKAAKASDDMATIVSAAIDVKRQLGQTGTKVISNEEELALTQGLVKVNAAVKAFHTQVKNTNKLDGLTKPQLMEMFKGVVDSVAELNQKGVLGIKNPEAKQKVTAILAGFQSAFDIIRMVLS